MTHIAPALKRTLSLAILIAVGGSGVAAHDMWIEPTGFLAPVGRTVGLKLRVGQDFLGDPITRDPALIERFIVLDGDATRPVVGRDGADPAGLIRVSGPGLMVVAYHSKPTPVVLQATKFNQYLTEEGLEKVAALRASRGETSAEAREIFVRCAKSLLLAGPAAESQHDRVVGMPLELVAERNPYLLAAGERLSVRLLYKSQPLAGTLVVALNQRDPTARVSARSDTTGRVQLRLAQPGPWLIKAVHMIPAPPGSDSQWASFWASLTFELSDNAGRAGTAAGR